MGREGIEGYSDKTGGRVEINPADRRGGPIASESARSPSCSAEERGGSCCRGRLSGAVGSVLWGVQGNCPTVREGDEPGTQTPACSQCTGPECCPCLHSSQTWKKPIFEERLLRQPFVQVTNARHRKTCQKSPKQNNPPEKYISFFICMKVYL